MTLCFLILVSTCLITGYFLLKNSHGEIAHLVGIFGIISLFFVLILAPWQFLLLVLITVLISTSSEYYTNKLNSTETEYSQQSLEQLKAEHNLSYRGVDYCAESNTKLDGVTLPQVPYQLSYRGSTYFIGIDSPNQTPKFTPLSVTQQLRFRGSTYSR